jgi:Mn2+/Fe2+ NRAMP family transporter
MLFWLAGCYLIALAFDSTLAFNLAKVAGGGSALLLHFIAAYVGLMINALVIFEIENSRDWPCSPMSQPWLTRIFGGLIVLAVVGVLGPSQQFFRGMIAETPDRFRSPTPTIILVFSAAILLIGPRCLVGIWKQGRSA